MPMRMSRIGLPAIAAIVALSAMPALAQIAHHPFAVGASEGAVGHQNALGAWLLGQESRFYLSLAHAVRASREDGAAGLTLVGLSFAYGIFHAAGPGHGKAVITSYMVSNEVALRRGLVIALLAALLQGAIATTLVGVAAFIFHATAPTMTAASQAIELTSYVGIVALGLLLVWRKGRAAWAMLAPSRRRPALAFAGDGLGINGFGLDGLGLDIALRESTRFTADDGLSHPVGCDCGHDHMPNPASLEGTDFDWKAAGLAMLTAGARPCSGSILVLIFALSQGIFLVGVLATFAMALGTALTTGTMATAAVLAKDLAMRVSGSGSSHALLVGRLVELVAAVCVLLFGSALLAAALSGVHAGA